MKFPKNKLDFLDVTAKVAAQREEVKDLIEAEPLLIMPFAIYTSALCDVFYPEDEDEYADKVNSIDHFKVKNTYFYMYERDDDVRLIIKKTNNIVTDSIFGSKVEALIGIIRYIEQCM